MKELLKKLIEFREKRDWTKYHTPENLAKSITIEASELLLNYQWENNPNIDNEKTKLINKEIKVYTEEDHLNKSTESISELYETLRQEILSLSGVKIDVKKYMWHSKVSVILRI